MTEIPEDTPEDKLIEWLVTFADRPPETIKDADAYREHAIDDLEEEGVTAEMIDKITGGKFGLYMLKKIGPKKWEKY